MNTNQKPQVRAYSRYCLDALALFGKRIRAERKKKRFSEHVLAERVGISRSTLQRIEQGHPGCDIGSVFQVAQIVGIPLFGMGADELRGELKRIDEILALLPERIRLNTEPLKEDF